MLNEAESLLSCKAVQGENTISAVYDKVGLVTVKHVDAEGNEIANSETYECVIGQAFDGSDYAKTNLIFESKVYNYTENADDEIVVSSKISENVIELAYEESDVSFDGKLAHFTFDDEETGFVSEFAKADNSGTNVLSNDAMKGKALYLNGSGANFLNITNAEGEALLTGLDEITIVFYAKVAGNGANWSVFMAPDTAGQVYAQEKYVGMLHNGNLIVERYLNSGSRAPSISVADPTGTWKKYALVIEEDTTTLYIDNVPTTLESSYKLSDILGDNSILQIGKAKIVKELVQRALDEGVEVEKILNEGLLAGMSIIGEKFKNNEVYVPEVLVAARAMNMGTQILKPHLAANGIVAKGKVCIGTVQGDLHDIGKNLVKMMLEGKGLEVIDLGTDVAPETFVNTAIEQGCQVICCSALLTTTMGVMEDVVKLAAEKGIRDTVKIMVGGAPVNEDYCKKIGADVYTSDAASAADEAVKICEALLA